MAGTLTFPPGLEVAIERETLTDVKVDRAESGFEVRTKWNNSPTYRYKFKATGRTNVSGTNEVTTLTAFYEANGGEHDTFTMTDPVDGVARTCRFSGPLKLKRVLPSSPRGAWWEMTWEARTVVNPS